MFGDKGRGKRMQNEAKRLRKQARKNGGELSGGDRARLRRIDGILNKTVYDNEYDQNDVSHYDDWD